ncbi:DUF2167 domain-containing protein [Flagellimonas sp. DF-77]|uniref:DUF2167 domain-containing protein n=1 Tax=Flagellimonas algarum TaxID=3230298 RepID=UPI003391CDA0
MKKYLLTTICAFGALVLHGQVDSTATEDSFDEEAYARVLDSINDSFTYQHGEISIGDDLATLHVPEGFGFLDAEQSQRLLTDLWGNPPSDPLGMLIPEGTSLLGDDFTYAIELTYSEDGYIDDEDAEDIDYDDLMDQMKEDAVAENDRRVEMGYPGIEIVGWAAKPYYDQGAKKLHWAKEIKFEGEEENTLNYNIRILGRKGYLTMNAISQMGQLPLVQENVEPIIASVEFNSGNRYSDFNPDLDEVAAYGIGGLIAGKVLAKAGFFALLLKFWKFIALGAVGLFGMFRRKLFGSKENS